VDRCDCDMSREHLPDIVLTKSVSSGDVDGHAYTVDSWAFSATCFKSIREMLRDLFKRCRALPIWKDFAASFGLGAIRALRPHEMEAPMWSMSDRAVNTVAKYRFQMRFGPEGEGHP
jgi:hypothetical protein